jgi:hypothetical protein
LAIRARFFEPAQALVVVAHLDHVLRQPGMYRNRTGHVPIELTRTGAAGRHQLTR